MEKLPRTSPDIVRFHNIRGLHSGRPLNSGLHGSPRVTLPRQSSSSREPLLGGTFEHAVSGISEADKQAIQVAGLADCFSRHGFGWEDGDGWLPGREAHYSRESLGACAKISLGPVGSWATGDNRLEIFGRLFRSARQLCTDHPLEVTHDNS
ncbi:hypothetical protein QBC33DRAFT_536965 [Phialemonium atrogriseum]|uniref:Uncharacterized protein n=1 Tax=Phialemonium atrogriseum TaxID=1093897 RepID=A0AAJ0C048_9PEZI|nr:uncharacterized protein QBC33DRAFT_536965 [Phialemonium atrogriseum]KAK1767679.1 hypothetical protein QBC33DRAFT_536965 [Phialemonium atrogriseum]